MAVSHKSKSLIRGIIETGFIKARREELKVFLPPPFFLFGWGFLIQQSCICTNSTNPGYSLQVYISNFKSNFIISYKLALWLAPNAPT